MHGSLVTFLATHADLITPTPRQLQASERGKSEERGAKIVGRISSPLIITITTTTIIIINTRNEKLHSSPSSLPSVPAKQGKRGTDSHTCYQIFSPNTPLFPLEKKKPSSFAPAAGTAL
jgi:hypothetical protein